MQYNFFTWRLLVYANMLLDVGYAYIQERG